VDLFISGGRFDRCHDRLSPERHARRGCAKRFFQKALRAPGASAARVINVDGNPSYPKVISELKRSGELGRYCRCRPVRYLNNVVEQTIQGIETMNMIRKGQMRWLAKDDM
jgi:transposase-like protein